MSSWRGNYISTDTNLPLPLYFRGLLNLQVTQLYVTSSDRFVWTMTLGRTSVGVPEVGTRITSRPLVPESCSLLDRALRHERHTVRVLRSSLPDSVPMDGDLQALYIVQNIDNHLVALTNLQYANKA